MSASQNSSDQALADRLVGYCDAIVALAFLISSGLGLAVADPDTRVTITDVASEMIIANIGFGVMFSLLLSILRRWEKDLRSGAVTTPKYQRYSFRIYLARHVVVWLTVAQTAFIMAALGD